MSAHAAIAAMMQAIKASGAIVRVEATVFQRLAARADEPLVVRTHGRGLFGSEWWEYLMGYKGLTFYAKSNSEILLSGKAEVLDCDKIWIPG